MRVKVGVGGEEVCSVQHTRCCQVLLPRRRSSTCVARSPLSIHTHTNLGLQRLSTTCSKTCICLQGILTHTHTHTHSHTEMLTYKNKHSTQGKRHTCTSMSLKISALLSTVWTEYTDIYISSHCSLFPSDHSNPVNLQAHWSVAVQRLTWLLFYFSDAFSYGFTLVSFTALPWDRSSWVV